MFFLIELMADVSVDTASAIQSPQKGLGASILIGIFGTIAASGIVFCAKYFVQKLSRLFFTKIRFGSKDLDAKIEKLGLGIWNRELLNTAKFVRSNRQVFFPVVPKTSPNLLHVTFVNVIKGLEQLGLHVIVFICDDYYGRVQGKNPKARVQEISNFSDRLQKMGIKKSSIVYESGIFAKSKKARKFITVFFETASKLTVKEFDELNIVNADHVGDNTKYIRRLKSLLNMAYLPCISPKIGFVLSGANESKLWETYAERVDKNGSKRLILLHIQNIYTTREATHGLSNVLDDRNLSQSDSEESLALKIGKTLSTPYSYGKNAENTDIFYFLKYNHFNLKGATICVNGREFKSITGLVMYCRNEFAIICGLKQFESIEFFETKNSVSIDGEDSRFPTIQAFLDFCKKKFERKSIDPELVKELSRITHSTFNPK